MTTRTTRTPDEIDLSTFPTDDGEPVAENCTNLIQMVDLMVTVDDFLLRQGRTRSTVGANQFLYYNPYNQRDHLAPDVFAALDVEPGKRQVWFTWVEGKAPDIVWEITSPSTRREDLGKKRDKYAELGVREYYIYDPDPHVTRAPRFLGLELREGRYEPLPLLPSGGIVSPLLGAELRPMPMAETEWRPAGVYLRVIDPLSGQPLPTNEETRQGFEAAQEQLWREEQERRAAEQRMRQEEQRANQEEQRANQEEQARRAAEQRAAQAEAALQAALAALQAQQHGSPSEGS